MEYYTDVMVYAESHANLIADMMSKVVFDTVPDAGDPPHNPYGRMAPGMKQAGSEVLFYLHATDQDIAYFESMDGMEILGTYEDIFDNPELSAIYDRVYDQAPVDVDDGAGGITVFSPPRKFIVFDKEKQV